MSNEIQRAVPVLPTYDPDWETRHDAIGAELDRVSEALSKAYKADTGSDSEVEKIQQLSQSSKELLRQLHAAFYSQFRTAPDLIAWCRDKLEQAARIEEKTLALVELPDPENATMDEVFAWMARGYEVLKEQDYKKLPVGQPPGLDAFYTDLLPRRTRTTFHLPYTGFSNSPSAARCTIEQTSDKAFVCFHHIPGDMGTSPTNAVEMLATAVRSAFLPQFAPGDITFFVHSPSESAGDFGENFCRADMSWAPEGYDTVDNWHHYRQLPPGIREAEQKPYDPMPRLQENLSHGKAAPSGRLRQRFSRLLRREQ